MMEAAGARLKKGPTKTAGPSPELTANIFSYITWQWVQPFINLGNKRTLEAEDLYDLLPRERVDYCERTWKNYFLKQKEKKGRSSPSLWKIVFISAGREMIWSFLAMPAWLAAVIAQVYVLKGIVTIAEESNKPFHWWKGLLLVLGMLVSSNVQSLSQHFSFTTGQKSGIKIRSAISMAVFNKLMKLRMVALGGTSSGQMLNLITNDTQKLIDACTFFSFTCFGVIDSVLVAGLAIGEMGVSALPGVAVIFMAQPVQMALAQGVGRMRKNGVKLTDARVRTIQEILTGVRVVKYNGWITAFLARIQEIRKVEMRWIRKGAFLRASTSTLRDGLSPVASLVTFGTYVGLHGGHFSAAKAFAILGLYTVLVRVYSICPTGVQAGWESKVGIQRLQSLMDMPDGKGQSSPAEVEQLRKIHPKALIAASNATFSWSIEDVEGDSKNTEASSYVPGRMNSKPRLSRTFSNQIHSDIPIDESPIIEDEQNEQRLATAILKDINLAISEGELVAVVGSVGSGKSSLLQALLGEMECLKGAFFIDKTVSYVPQQPWILNDTIKNNIVFASDYDEARYKRTVFACALNHDIDTMAAGDETEIGERGVNLSGGQKARISLARACYSSTEVVLLDDPLAAVDVPTARHLMENVLKGVLKGRTVILVTHNKSSLELCDRVFLMDNGRLQEMGSKEDVIQNILPPEAELEEEEEEKEEVSEMEQINEEYFSSSFRYTDSGIQSEANYILEDFTETRDPRMAISRSLSRFSSRRLSFSVENSEPAAGFMESAPVFRRSSHSRNSSRRSWSRRNSVRKSIAVEDVEKGGTETAQVIGGLTVSEDRAIGEVTWGTYGRYVLGGGLVLWIFVIFLMCFGQAVRVMVDYWLAIWVTSKYHLSTDTYLGVYAVWVAGMLVFSLSRGLLFTEATIRAAKTIHSRMAESVLRSPQLFFDQNPVGRIMNRFSKDQAMVDELLPFSGQGMFENIIAVIAVMVFVAVIMPWFLICLPPFIFVLWYCQRRYVAVSRELKRIDGLSRSPIYAHFAQTLQGVISVRAYGTEKAMHDYFSESIDANNRAYMFFVHTSRWLGIRLDFAAALCVTASSFLSILLRRSVSPGLIGVVLIQSLQLTGFFQYGVRLIADTETIFTSVERNQAYGELPSEADPNSPPGLISKEWPEKGKIEFRNYTMTYRIDLPPVLNDLTFQINPEEKVGILGRTGAGKSSLAAALFRMVENVQCNGTILIDDVDLKLVGLDDLRLRLSIIPQDPVLFRGTVRLNLDPFQRHSDVEIYESLAKVQLMQKIKSLDSGLDSTVTENGDNFSVGQRQLLCLARSLLRRSKIIVMDEATAAVDGETDQLIQNTMRSVFHDCTVLTIAHRIDTVIDCDRVLVLAKGGYISEFDSPMNLLRRAEERESDSTAEDHLFANMVLQAGPVIAKQLRDAAETAETKRRLAR